MINYPKDILGAYTERQISREDFVKRFSEWQTENSLDYTFKKIVNGLEFYFVYRNITATIKNNKLHFKTYKHEVVKTPFEFRRKVDFYYADIEKAKHRAKVTSCL